MLITQFEISDADWPTVRDSSPLWTAGGGGRPAKPNKRINISIALNADRVEAYKEYLSVLDGGRDVTDKNVTEWIRTMLYGEIAGLDELVEREKERMLVV